MDLSHHSVQPGFYLKSDYKVHLQFYPTQATIEHRLFCLLCDSALWLWCKGWPINCTLMKWKTILSPGWHLPRKYLPSKQKWSGDFLLSPQWFPVIESHVSKCKHIPILMAYIPSNMKWQQRNGVDFTQNTLELVNPKDCSPLLWNKLKQLCFRQNTLKYYEGMSFGVKECTDHTVWSLKNQNSFFKKSKQIQHNHPFYSSHFTPNDVYLLPKIRPIFKKGRFGAI